MQQTKLRSILRRAIKVSLVTGLLLVSFLVLCEGALWIREKRQIKAIQGLAEPRGVVQSDIPGLNYTLRPGTRKGGTAFNSLGLNMPERPISSTPGRTRIAFVGDSVTQGVGASQTADAYPNRVHALLEQEQFDCWNHGVAGYNISQTRIYVNEMLPQFKPDAIIYGFNFNDYWEPYHYFYGHAAATPGHGDSRDVAWLDRLKRIRTVTAVNHIYADLAYRARGYPPSYVDHKTEYPSWITMKATFLEFRDDVAKWGLPFAVLVLPNEQFLFRSDAENIAHQNILRWLQENKVMHLDLVPILRPRRAEPVYQKDGNHMTSLGHQVVAKAVAAWITENKVFFRKESQNR